MDARRIIGTEVYMPLPADAATPLVLPGRDALIRAAPTLAPFALLAATLGFVALNLATV